MTTPTAGRRVPRAAPKMRRAVMAIDPGPERSAWLVLAGGKPTGFGMDTNTDVLAALRIIPEMVAISPLRPDLVVIEQIESFGMAVGREVFETVRWAGRFEEAAGPVPVVLLPRRAVKLHLCGSSRAKDTNIRQALIDRYGGPSAVGTTKARGPLYGIHADVWSALAIAITYSDTGGG